MPTVLKENITYETCPICGGRNESADPCPLCKGRGQVPTDDVYYLSGGQAYSSAWWTCECFQDYLHPEFCEACKTCGVTRDEGSDALVAEVTLYLSRLRAIHERHSIIKRRGAYVELVLGTDPAVHCDRKR